MNLFRPSELHAWLDLHELKAKKVLSQNFLIEGNILQNIIKTADVKKEELILEIGPGPGALTQALLKKGARVIAVEKDPSFASLLPRLQTSDKRLEVFEDDFLTFPLESVLKERLSIGCKAKVVANLPYHITTPILTKLLPLFPLLDSVTVMVQREVARRFVAKCSSKEYSSFSIFLQYYSIPQYAFTVEPTCFYPKPTVQSAVVTFSLRPPPKLDSPNAFFTLVRTAFGKRRKMLRSSLKEIYTTDNIESALTKTGKNPLCRPEELSFEQFLALFRELSLPQNF